ncbi:MAG TPA: hypothetical protein VKL61_09970, partial [Candidatus Polarisedimenticolia bacterium]|nr:hypothetical protein [Candidatus Polarisedimenticolia bacterium]
MSLLPTAQESLDLVALQGAVAAGGTAAADHRKAALPGVVDDLLLPDVDQGTNHRVPTVLGAQHRR